MRMHGPGAPISAAAQHNLNEYFTKVDMKRGLAKYRTKDMMIISQRKVNNGDKQAVFPYPA